MPDRENAISIAEVYFDNGGFLQDITRLVTFETESQNSDKTPELFRYLGEAIAPILSNLGFEFEVFENPNPRGPDFAGRTDRRPSV